MDSNSTLLIDVSKQGKIEIIDIKEVVNLDKQIADIFLDVKKSKLTPSQQTINKILNEL
jgi:hypothetical protein